MTTKRYFFLVSEQTGLKGRTTSILITKALTETSAKQEFFDEFSKAALDNVESYSQEEFVAKCKTNVTPWVIENLSNLDRLQPSEFYYKLQIHSRFG
jgi:hypothetical protein